MKTLYENIYHCIHELYFEKLDHQAYIGEINRHIEEKMNKDVCEAVQSIIRRNNKERER